MTVIKMTVSGDRVFGDPALEVPDQSNYGDEVLQASWLPELGLALQNVTPSERSSQIDDVEGFMARLYWSQA